MSDYSCSLCDYQMHDANPADAEAHVIDTHAPHLRERPVHIVTFDEVGYGLQHPPACRPNLLGCRYNRYLAYDLDEVPELPGRYVMTLSDTNVVSYEADSAS